MNRLSYLDTEPYPMIYAGAIEYTISAVGLSGGAGPYRSITFAMIIARVVSSEPILDHRVQERTMSL